MALRKRSDRLKMILFSSAVLTQDFPLTLAEDEIT